MVLPPLELFSLRKELPCCRAALSVSEGLLDGCKAHTLGSQSRHPRRRTHNSPLSNYGLGTRASTPMAVERVERPKRSVEPVAVGWLDRRRWGEGADLVEGRADGMWTAVRKVEGAKEN